jgi:hypothetical protein
LKQSIDKPKEDNQIQKPFKHSPINTQKIENWFLVHPFMLEKEKAVEKGYSSELENKGIPSCQYK